jgi:small subunit ribosomal protein S17
MQEEPNNTTTAENDPLNLTGSQPAAAADAAVDAAAGNSAGAEAGHRKIRTGLVVSNKMQKSIVVEIIRRVRHPLYKKYFNKTKRYMAHDETNEAKVGDTVRIIETRPLSARKRWRLDAIVDKAK